MRMRTITELQRVKIAFMKAILDYFVATGHWSIADNMEYETSASMINFFDSEWPAVKDSFVTQSIRTGTSSDFTCHFVCELLAGRIKY